MASGVANGETLGEKDSARDFWMPPFVESGEKCGQFQQTCNMDDG